MTDESGRPTGSATNEAGLKKKAYDATWSVVLKATTRGHKALHKATGGRLGKTFLGGAKIIWITTYGRKSHEWRTTPLLAVPDGESCWVVTGSNAGQAKIPGWVFNVRERTDGFVEVDKHAWNVRFEEATDDDRDRLYEQLKQSWKSYGMYERMSGRYIPVFRVLLEEPIALSSIPGHP